MPPDMIPIGKFSEITRLSRKALYCYERKGLLVPVQRDICSGYRYYSNRQIESGIWIGSLISLGFSMEEAAAVIGAEDRTDPVIQSLIDKRLTDVRDEIKRLRMVERILSSERPFEEMFRMKLENWTVKEVPPLRVMINKGEGAYNETIGPLIEDLCIELSTPVNQENQVRCAGPVMVTYTGENCDESGGSIEVALQVAGPITLSNEALELRTLPGIRVLSVLHRGPYHTLPMAHKTVYEYIQEHDLEWIGPVREFYLNDPAETPEEDLMTEIQYPVR